MQNLFNKLRGTQPQPQPDAPQPVTEDPDSQQPKLSLTEHLLLLSPDAYRAATQSPSLRLAAEGRLPKPVLGRWLAGERLYLHLYIRAAGRLLASVELPRGKTGEEDGTMRLVDWVIEDLVRIREEERRLVEVSGRYGIAIEGGEGGWGGGPGPVEGWEGSVAGRDAVLALVGDSLDALGAVGVRTVSQPNEPAILPWLEAAVMFWGTERVFVDAWSWVREQSGQDDGARDDADGGALRREFMPSWSGDGLKDFVARLQVIIDDAVAKDIDKGGNNVRDEALRRTEGKWKSLIAGAGGFWTGLEVIGEV